MSTEIQTTISPDIIAAMLAQLNAIEARLNEALSLIPKLPPDARKAMEARAAAQARGFFWTAEFAAVVGRHPQWVSDRCAARVIKPLPGGTPYRIPLSAEDSWNRGEIR